MAVETVRGSTMLDTLTLISGMLLDLFGITQFPGATFSSPETLRVQAKEIVDGYAQRPY